MATDSGLNLDPSEATDLLCFDGDLLCQLSRWGDDDATDIVSRRPVCPYGLSFCERGILLNYFLEGREKEAKGLARASPGLSDTGKEKKD